MEPDTKIIVMALAGVCAVVVLALAMALHLILSGLGGFVVSAFLELE